MPYFYDPKLNAIYDLDKKITPESHLVPISDERNTELFQAQNQGMIIVADENGQPITIQPEISLSEIAAQKKFDEMTRATAEINLLQDAVELDIATEEEQARLLAWKKYRVLLSRIHPEDGDKIVWPDSSVSL